jgi:hypothetical protein
MQQLYTSYIILFETIEFLQNLAPARRRGVAGNNFLSLSLQNQQSHVLYVW